MDGMDLLEAISQIEVDKNEVPAVPITIKRTGELML